MVKTYFPELEEKKSMATEPEGKWSIYGWFGCISPETKEVRLNIVKDIIKELEGDYTPLYAKKRKTIYICTKYHTGYHQYPLPVAQK